ncbi:MAG TPA: hypothetical protein VFA09_21730 [Ktedonobacteraceae bacterium]|nr:hypothetical protein [Ktedonobacteraceae bacterium]
MLRIVRGLTFLENLAPSRGAMGDHYRVRIMVFHNILRQRTRGRSIGGGRDQSAPTAEP